MPMTGLFDWGDTMFRGTIMICSSSAFAATDCGTCLRRTEGEAQSGGDGVFACRFAWSRYAHTATREVLDSVRNNQK